MSIMLSDRPVALITGASKGIGADIAEVLARSGARVILIGRDEPALLQIVSILRSEGCDSEYYVCDVTDHAKMTLLINKIDKINILINCASTILIKKFEDYTEDDFDVICNLNIKSYFMISQSVVRKMKNNSPDKGGIIINISSIMGKVAQPIATPRPQVLYTLSKHAIEGLTKALSVELASLNIRVNSVCPTYVLTDLTKELMKNEKTRDFFLNKIPMGKFVEKNDVSNAVLFLCSSMAKMITGESLMVDGGWTAS
jgi:NAD(P)-dependent dehydrogenase (short-subunit alcohol dehydrogenase family)